MKYPLTLLSFLDPQTASATLSPVLYVACALVLVVLALIATGGHNIDLFLVLLPVPIALAGIAIFLGKLADPESEIGFRISEAFRFIHKKEKSRAELVAAEARGGKKNPVNNNNTFMQKLMAFFKLGKDADDEEEVEDEESRRRRIRERNAAAAEQGAETGIIDRIFSKITFLVKLRDSLRERYAAQRSEIGAVPISSQRMALAASRNFFLSVIGGFLMSVVLFALLGHPVALALGPAAAAVTYMTQRNKLSTHIAQRKKGVDRELLFFVAFADIVDNTQSNIAKVFDEIRVDTVGMFTTMRDEARIIHREYVIFGKSMIEILADLVKTHPSEMFQDFLRGYITSQTGGGTKTGNFMKEQIEAMSERTQDIMNSFAGKAEAMGMLGGFGLAMVSIMIVLMSAFMTTAMLTLIAASMCIISPVLVIVMIQIIGSIQPFKMPAYVRSNKPIFAAGGVLLGGIILTFIIDFIVLWHVAMAAGATWGIMNFISCVGQFKFIRNMEKNLFDFIKELSRLMAVESDFTQAFSKITKNEAYNKDFNEMLKKIESRCRTGLNIDEAIAVNIQAGRSWLLNVVMYLLSYTSRSGTVQPAVLENIAGFAKMYRRMLEVISTKAQTAVMIAFAGSIITAFMMGMLPSVTLDSIAPLAGNNPQITNADFSQATENKTLSDMNRLLLVVSSFFSGVLVSKIKFGTILHSIIPMIMVIMVGAIFLISDLGALTEVTDAIEGG